MRYILGLYGGSKGIMENKMENNYLGFRVCGLGAGGLQVHIQPSMQCCTRQSPSSVVSSTR